MRPISAFVAVAKAQAAAVSAPASAASQRSPWHSPVPYLFGGLAAMLGLIAFALLILACSYWRLTAREEDRRDAQREDGEKDESAGSAGKSPPVYEEKVLVIMAGDARPTFLATPACPKVVITVKESAETMMREKEVEERENSVDGKVKEEFAIAVDHDHHSDGEHSHVDEESRRRSQ